MFLKKPDHTEYKLRGGLYTVYLPPAPSREHIAFSQLKKEDQFWRRTPIPQWYVERRAEEEAKQLEEQLLVEKGDLDKVRYVDIRCEEYRRQQWMYRIYGYWFMNNGKPVYLTGAHWYYLQWCKLDHDYNEGYPLFYKSQLERFYFRRLCWEDPWCHGYIIVGPRGFGKTSEEAAVSLEDITKPPYKRQVTIQSKTADDAQTVIFSEKMVPMFNELPHFFQPVFNHGADPGKIMKFRKKAVPGNKVKESDHLNSTVKWYPAKEKAVDGKGVSNVISDEIGKTHPKLEANVQVRHSVHLKCVFRNNRKVGLIRESTTVEEMNEGGNECWEIWKDSNPLDRGPDGYTKSKVYKYMVSAVETQTQFADKYGEIDLLEANKAIDDERTPFKNDAVKLSQVMRKNPRTENEAFIKDASQCLFNIIVIQKALDNIGDEPQGRRGDLQWVRGVVDGDVEFIDNPLSGKFIIYIALDATKNGRKLLNNQEYILDGNKKIWLPTNNDIIRGGLDPIKYVKTADPRASRMAAFGFLMHDALVDESDKPREQWKTYNLAWEYCERHDDPEEDYENLIKAMRYFGHSFMPESNINDFNKHVYGRNWQRFLIMRKDFDPSVLTNKHTKNAISNEQVGAQSGGEVTNTYVKEIKQYVNAHGTRIPSRRLLEDLRDFDSLKPTLYDRAVAFGYCLLALKANLEDFNHQKLAEMVVDPFQTYDISGNRSQAIEQNYGQEDDGVSDFINNADKFNAWLNKPR